MRTLTIVLAGAWSIALSACSPPVNAPREFNAGSMEAIAREHAGAPMLVNFWSVGCPPCREEMPMLAQLRREHPEIAVVTIATDGLAERNAVIDALKETALSAAENWIFADEFVEQLRYEVDPSWYGELPRTFLYSANGQRETVVGKISPSVLQSWLASASTN